LTTKAALLEGFFDRRNKILRDVGATRLIFKLKNREPFNEAKGSLPVTLY
jgi:hypothetical protein